MKKFIALILATSLLGLTACSTSTDPLEDPTDISNETSEPVLSNPEENSGYSDIENSESKSENSNAPESNSSEDNTSKSEIIAPDGSALSESEAISADDLFLKFDFSYIRYAQPIFYNTLDNPKLIDWETLEFGVDRYAAIENPNYFKIKAGDKLENGLTVKSAEYMAYRNGNIMYSLIDFDGEITLEGILHCHSEDGYNIKAGQLEFWADTTKANTVPLPCGSTFETDRINWAVNTADEVAFACDGGKIFVGNLDNIMVDLSGVIAPGECIKAKVTIKDLHKGWSDSNGFISRAELVSAEAISD